MEGWTSLEDEIADLVKRGWGEGGLRAFDRCENLIRPDLVSDKLCPRVGAWGCWHLCWLDTVPRLSMVHLFEEFMCLLLCEIRSNAIDGVVTKELLRESPEVPMTGVSNPSGLIMTFHG